MVDLTAALEAAARARWDQARAVASHLSAWEDLDAARQHRIREDLLPAVTAAAGVVEATVRADFASQKEDLSWRRQFAELTSDLTGPELTWPTRPDDPRSTP